jgi:hypothetical protein
MASLPSYPPSITHPAHTHNLSLIAAHDFLSTFLHLSTLEPAYRPDSTLSERGPQANSSAGNPNLTLHHLGRIKLGLEGTHLGVENLDEGLFGKKVPAAKEQRDRGQKRKYEDRNATASSAAKVPKVTSTINEEGSPVLEAQEPVNQQSTVGQGWQDREDFELAQDDEDVDMNNAQRDPAADLNDAGGMVLDTQTGRMINVAEEAEREDGVVEEIRTGDALDARRQELQDEKSLTKAEKAERKRLKAERRKKEKKTANVDKAKGEGGSPVKAKKKKKTNIEGNQD